MHSQVLILTSSMSGKGKISCWQAFSNSGDSIQEAFCHLGSVPLETTVVDALEEYVCKLFQTDTDIVQLTELRWWMFRRKQAESQNYHLQELRFWKVSNVRNINASFGNPHLTLILTYQCLTIMAGGGTVINIFPS